MPHVESPYERGENARQYENNPQNDDEEDDSDDVKQINDEVLHAVLLMSEYVLACHVLQ